MTSDDERKRRKKSHKSSSRGESGGRRHRHRDEEEDRHHHDQHDNKRRKKKEKSKLTEEEERLYAKAQQFVLEREKEKKQQKKYNSSKSSRHDKKDGKRRRRSHSESYDDSINTEGDTRKRSSSSRKEHRKHTKKKDDQRNKKKSKHEEKRTSKHHKKKHSSKTTSSFKDKATTKIDTSKLVSLGNIVSSPPPNDKHLDSTTNYFSHNSHLRLYLYRTYGIYFEDLTSSESHTAFQEFINEYNTGKLEQAYYNTNDTGLLPQDALDQCSRTKHQWKFKTNKLEEKSLDMVRKGVKKQTEYNNNSSSAMGNKKGDATAALLQQQQGVSIGPTAARRPQVQKRETPTPSEIAAQRQSDKRHLDRIKLANEEMYGISKGDPGSYERQQLKKREVSSKLHGAAHDRESEAMGELNDDAIYGTGGDITGGRRRGGRGGEQTYEEALAREKQHRERRENEKAARTSELLKKEEEKKRQMFEMLGFSGLKPGEKIKIAPRND